MIKIIAVGSLKNKGYQIEIVDYLKQLDVKTEIIEVKDEPSIEGVQIEGKRILSKIKISDHVVVLAILGKMFDSESFAGLFSQWQNQSIRDIVFIIGGSYGVSADVLKRANLEISFSKMTFPHQLMRLILVEQIYRAHMILKNHPYHK